VKLCAVSMMWIFQTCICCRRGKQKTEIGNWNGGVEELEVMVRMMAQTVVDNSLGHSPLCCSTQPPKTPDVRGPIAFSGSYTQCLTGPDPSHQNASFMTFDLARTGVGRLTTRHLHRIFI
jgi:hypothetical protein